MTRRTKIENSQEIVEYIPIQNKKSRILESEIDEFIGYIADVHKNYSS